MILKSFSGGLILFLQLWTVVALPQSLADEAQGNTTSLPVSHPEKRSGGGMSGFWPTPFQPTFQVPDPEPQTYWIELLPLAQPAQDVVTPENVQNIASMAQVGFTTTFAGVDDMSTQLATQGATGNTFVSTVNYGLGRIVPGPRPGQQIFMSGANTLTLIPAPLVSGPTTLGATFGRAAYDPLQGRLRFVSAIRVGIQRLIDANVSGRVFK